MVEESTQPSGGIKGIALRATRGLSLWALLSASLAVIFTIAAVELVPIGPQFAKGVITAWSLATLVSALIIATPQVLKKKGTPSSKRSPLERGQGIALIIIGVLGVVLPFIILFLEREITEMRNESKAERAKSRFAITHHLGGGPEFGKESLEQTLAELEDSYLQLRRNWTIHQETERINIWLFRDLQAYSEATEQDDATGHVWCSHDQGPVISIPLEEAPSASKQDNFSRTPMHEMVHALICQGLGRERFIAIPSWFHEGIATRYETEGFLRVKMRIEIRVATWLKRNELLDQERFCTESPQRMSRLDAVLFYASAHEFVRFLQSKYELSSINMVVEDVRTRLPFEESIQKRFGGTCQEIYGDWKATF